MPEGAPKDKPVFHDIKRRKAKLGSAQKEFRNYSLSAMIAGLTIVIGTIYLKPSYFTLQFGFAMSVTVLTLVLYVVRYEAIAAYYHQETGVLGMSLSIGIAATGFMVILTTILASYWLLTYGVLLVLSIAKQVHTIRILNEKKRRLEKIPKHQVTPENIDEFALNERDLIHEKDTISWESSLAVFLVALFVIINTNLGTDIGLDSGAGLVVGEIVLLCYVVALILNKLARFNPLISQVLDDEV